jgi:PKD repeat protein
VNAPLPPNCNASFNFYRQMNAGFTFRFVPMTMAPGTVYLWQFGDGDTSTLRTPVHTYADTGVYHVCLTVVTTNSAGSCSATVCRNLVVRPLWTANSFCSAAFAYNRVPNVPGLFQFTAFSSGGSLRYSWNFGDSTTSNQPNPLHQYTAAGAYNICLTVRDTITNCTSRICRWLLLGPNLMPTDTESEEDEAADRLSEQTSALHATVFPNPAEDHVTLLLSGTSGNATCSVSDVTGKVVFELAGVSDGSYTLPFDRFSPGIYIFRIIEAGQAPFTGRFLVK